MEKTKYAAFRAAFEAPSEADWMALVERDLKGAAFEKRLVSQTEDGIRIQPLYAGDSQQDDAAGFPGVAPYTRGTAPLPQPWRITVPLLHPDVDAATKQAQQAVTRGATGLWLQFDARARAGRDRDQGAELPTRAIGGLPLCSASQLAPLLAVAEPTRTWLALDAGGAALNAAAVFVAALREQGVALDAVHGSFGCDPLGALADDGWLPAPLEQHMAQMTDLAVWTQRHMPHMRAIVVSTLPYHNAGATEAQELGIALSTAAQYLRQLVSAGMTIDEACSQISLRLSVGRDVFVQLAKLRAARWTWARMVAACGGSDEAQRVHIHASTSRRTKTKRDPWVNMLRSSVEGFAASAGGADAITTAAYDETLGLSDVHAQRISRNTQIILGQEAHIGRVADPAGGSYYVESLTRSLAENAWAAFQQIEQAGGAAEALTAGKLQQEIAEASQTRNAQIAKRKLPVTGVSTFPNVLETAPVRDVPDMVALSETQHQVLAEHLKQHDQAAAVATLADAAKAAAKASELGQLTATAIDAAAAGATQGRMWEQVASGEPLALETPLKAARDAEPYEQLRDKSDAFSADAENRPRVFLANLGPIPQHRLRAEFVSNVLQAGGIVPLQNDGFGSGEAAAEAFATSGAKAVVICSTDDDYAERAPAVAAALKAKGARSVLLAGRPGENESRFRAAGIDHFIFMGCNVHATLQALLAELEAAV